ncbi:MAG: metalloregulator ArsR/SmtB family transcription factor [Bacteroidota bacterium]
MEADVFKAIADPVRRDIIGLLAREKMTVKTVADHFSISRPAISRHLRVLRECGLVAIQQQGRERVCQIQPEELAPVFEWMEPYRKMWEAKLDSFEAYLEGLKKDRGEE